LKMIAGDEKPELARGGSHSIAQVLQRAYVHNGGQIRAVHHVEKILVNDGGRAAGVRLRADIDIHGATDRRCATRCMKRAIRRSVAP